jgi:hypothetical protein
MSRRTALSLRSSRIITSRGWMPWATRLTPGRFWARHPGYRSIELMTCVTCPITRYHPAVVAQKAATVGVLADGRLVAAALGTSCTKRRNVITSRGAPRCPKDSSRPLSAAVEGREPRRCG